jgi:hypothetical protein
LYGAVAGALAAIISALVAPDDPVTGIVPTLAWRFLGLTIGGAFIGAVLAIVQNFRERDWHDR